MKVVNTGPFATIYHKCRCLFFKNYFRTISVSPPEAGFFICQKQSVERLFQKGACRMSLSLLLSFGIQRELCSFKNTMDSTYLYFKLNCASSKSLESLLSMQLCCGFYVLLCVYFAFEVKCTNSKPSLSLNWDCISSTFKTDAMRDTLWSRKSHLQWNKIKGRHRE